MAIAIGTSSVAGLPVIAINAATWWMALRDNGIEDKIYSSGRLLREH